MIKLENWTEATNTVDNMVMQVRETRDEFIFMIETGKIIEYGGRLIMNPVTYNNLKKYQKRRKRSE